MNAIEIARKFGWILESEVAYLRELAKACMAGYARPVFVNIGAGAGTSSQAFLEGRPDATIFSIDVSPDRLNLELSNVDSGEKIIPVCRSSTMIGHAWPKQWHINLLFVDGDHEQVANDIREWFPKIMDGGYIIFHDYGEKAPGNEQWPQVRRDVDIFETQYSSSIKLVGQVGMVKAFEVTA